MCLADCDYVSVIAAEDQDHEGTKAQIWPYLTTITCK